MSQRTDESGRAQPRESSWLTGVVQMTATSNNILTSGVSEPSRQRGTQRYTEIVTGVQAILDALVHILVAHPFDITLLASWCVSGLPLAFMPWVLLICYNIFNTFIARLSLRIERFIMTMSLGIVIVEVMFLAAMALFTLINVLVCPAALACSILACSILIPDIELSQSCLMLGLKTGLALLGCFFWIPDTCPPMLNKVRTANDEMNAWQTKTREARARSFDLWVAEQEPDDNCVDTAYIDKDDAEILAAATEPYLPEVRMGTEKRTQEITGDTTSAEGPAELKVDDTLACLDGVPVHDDEACSSYTNSLGDYFEEVGGLEVDEDAVCLDAVLVHDDYMWTRSDEDDVSQTGVQRDKLTNSFSGYFENIDGPLSPIYCVEDGGRMASTEVAQAEMNVKSGIPKFQFNDSCQGELSSSADKEGSNGEILMTDSAPQIEGELVAVQQAEDIAQEASTAGFIETDTLSAVDSIPPPICETVAALNREVAGKAEHAIFVDASELVVRIPRPEDAMEAQEKQLETIISASLAREIDCFGPLTPPTPPTTSTNDSSLESEECENLEILLPWILRDQTRRANTHQQTIAQKPVIQPGF